ncbi:MAG: hypothetical protein AAGB31_06510 [Bdellovibrio sp.]
MSWVFSVPGKTFLAGEYLALQEGPCLLFLSQPCFRLTIAKKKEAGQELSKAWPALHPDSPAGRFLQKQAAEFADLTGEFHDPYGGRGGFGASTAQFLAVYAAFMARSQVHREMENILDYKHLLQAYYEVAWNGQGQRPSGADLVGQLKGAFTFFEKRKGLISVGSWPFAELEFLLVHTGNKVATHEHLRSLAIFDASSLEKSFALIKEAFVSAREELLLSGVNAYAQALRDLNFTCPESLNLLAEVRTLPGVRAAKGCGALGADVLWVITDKKQTAEVKKYFAQHKSMSVLSSSEQVSVGLQMQGGL